MRRSDERPRESRNSRDYADEERSRDLERKRREWRIEQEKRREHEKRKQKMIEEWERKRARELEAKKQRRRSKSRSRSASPGPSRRRRSHSGEARKSKKVPVMSEKCNSSLITNNPLFKGSEGSKISVNELKKIKVNIQREISNAEETQVLLRDITSPDEIVLKRREEEGSKPIFERDDIRVNSCSEDEVRERRTIIAVDEIETDKKRSSKRSRSVSSERQRSRSSRRHSSPEIPIVLAFAAFILKVMSLMVYLLNVRNVSCLSIIIGEGSKPIFEREELKTEKSTTVDVPERRTVVAVDKIGTDKKHSSKRRSRSLSSGRHTSRSSYRPSRHDAESKSYADSTRSFNSHDRGDRSDNRYHERRFHDGNSSHDPSRDSRSHRSSERDRNSRTESYRDSAYRERHDYQIHSYSRRNGTERRPAATLSYEETMPFSVYYDNLVRPMMVDPMMMMRTPLPVMRGRMPAMMTSFRPPYRPRFMPPEIFRMNAPPHPRYGRMF